MGKSNFLDVSDRFERQMMEEKSSSISSGFLIIFALLPLSFLFFYLAQICHCSFFISLFPGFGFLPCFSWWAQRCSPWSSVHLCFPWRARIPDSFWHSDPSSFPFYLLTVFSHLFRYDFQAVWQLLLPTTSQHKGKQRVLHGPVRESRADLCTTDCLSFWVSKSGLSENGFRCLKKNAHIIKEIL